MDVVPALRCVLQHWYELRPAGEAIGSANNRRLTDLKALHMVARRQGLDALRGALLEGAQGRRVIEPAFLPLGAGLFRDNLEVETFVRRGLRAQRADYRIAASYASVFYVKQSQEIACIVTEQALLGRGLEQQASAEALHLAQSLPCAACGRKKVDSWCPTRSF